MHNEQKSSNFILMILFLVFAISGAKVVHDITTSEAKQSSAVTQLAIEE